MFEILDDYYTIYTDYDDEDRFRIKLQCMDPSRNLSKCYERVEVLCYSLQPCFHPLL